MLVCPAAWARGHDGVRTALPYARLDLESISSAARHLPCKAGAMDLAYDYIQDDVHPKDQGDASSSNSGHQPTLNDDIQDAYKAISSSAWGIKIGGFLGNVVKQVQSHAPPHVARS